MNAELPCVAGVEPDEALDQLNRILADKRFAASGRGAQFLRYVVERTLAGRTDELKEVVIAMEVYGRSSDYNPKIDSVVRVEATRLRAKLKSYYDEDGAADQLRISIPKGGYVAVFDRRSDEADKALPDSQFPADQAPALASFEPQPAPVLHKPAPRLGQISWIAIFAVLLSLGWMTKEARSSYANSVSTLSARNPEAFAAWREGSQLLDLDPHTGGSTQGTPQILRRAIERFEFAVAQDPTFAPAWASLAEAYDYSSSFVDRNWDRDIQQAEHAAKRAIALDDRFAPGHAILGLVLFTDRFQFAEAEKEYRRALELEPRSPYAIVELADLLRETGRPHEAESELRKARALLPGMPVLASKQAEVELDLQQFDAAIATASAAIDLKRDYGRAYVVRGSAYERKGDFARALENYQAAAAMKGEERRALPALGHLLGRMGRHAEARAALTQLAGMHATLRNCGFQMAVVEAGLGNHDKALEWLDHAYKTRQAMIPFIAVEYRLEPLRGHPRFQELLRQLGLPRPSVAQNPQQGSEAEST